MLGTQIGLAKHMITSKVKAGILKMTLIVCCLAVGEALFALCLPEVGADLLVPFVLLALFVL